MLVGQTTEMCSPEFCMTTGVERSFCPASGVRAEEFHAIALNGAAGRDIDIERSLAHRLGDQSRRISALATGSTLLSSTQVWLKPIEQCGGTSVALGLGLVTLDHDLDQIAEPGRELLRVEQLRRHRIDVAEIIDVFAERRAQLVELAVAGAVADQHLEPQPALARLAQEQRDVRVVADMEMTSGAARLSLVTSEERSGAVAE